jgi:hypothetical protein
VAGPSIAVQVLADFKNFTRSLDTAGKSAQTAAAKMHDAFSGTLNALNQTGVLGPFSDALSGIDQAIGRVKLHAADIGPTMVGVGGALAGVGAGLAVLGSKDQAAHQQLQAAVEATGKSYDDYAGRVDTAIKHQEKFGDTSAQTQDALRILTQATGDPTKALNDLSVATDLAAAKHESLDTAATQVGKAYNGNSKILKEFGITTSTNTKHVTDHSKVIGELATKLHGQASAAADTFTGKLDAVKAHVEDAAASFGQKYGPAITAAGSAVAVLGGTVSAAQAVLGVFKTTEEVTAAATEGLAAAEDVAAVSEGLALAPILLIVGALALLGAAAYLIYRNWTTIWDGIKTAVKVVWDWIKNNWPLLLAIILGPIGIAIDLVIKNWKRIKDAVLDVINWIRTHWPVLLAILTGPFGLAVLEIVRHWNDLVGFFTGLPGKIASIAAGMWHGISDAFKDTINFLIDIWNKLHFTLPKINIGPFHVGGETIGVPHIPHLAQGGLITQTGLVMAHAGEAITPIDKVPRGPAVVIQNANFSTELDVDMFMRRAAWVMQTAKL